MNKLKKVQSYTARWIINAFRTTQGGVASIMAGLPPLAAELDKLMDATHRHWQSLPPSHGISLLMAKPNMDFIDAHQILASLVLTRNGLTPTRVKPKKPGLTYNNASPLLRAATTSWQLEYKVDWNTSFVRQFPSNMTWRARDWHRQVEDISQSIEDNSEAKDVYVVLVAVDQQLSKNLRGHGILAKLGRGAEVEVFHFPLPFRLHFKATVHAITNAIEIITMNSAHASILYTAHHYVFKHTLLPSYSEYGRDALASSTRLASWPHHLKCAWVTSSEFSIQETRS